MRIQGTLLACLALAACTAGPDFLRPQPPAADRYLPAATDGSAAAAAAASAQQVELGHEIEGHWWQAFHSEAIDALVAEALARNPGLEAASATAQQAQELAAAAGGERLPQLDLGAGAGRQQYGHQFLGKVPEQPPFTYYAIGPRVGYTLDFAGGVARRVERQAALAEEARHRLDAAYLAVTGQAVLQAITLASAEAQIATAQAIVAQDQDNLRLVQRAFDEGSVPRADVLSARSQLAGDLTALPLLRQQGDQARHALAVVLGRAPADAPPGGVDLEHLVLPHSLPVSLPSELAHRRPDILAAEARLHAATSAFGVATANLYPQVQLSAAVAQQALRPEQLFDAGSSAWSLIAGLTQPVFDGGTRRAERRAAEAGLKASAADYQRTVLAAFGQVADVLTALAHDAEELDAQAQAQQAAASNLELARISYREGNAGVLQVLDAQRQYQQARLGYVRALAQRYIDTVQLFLALGGASADRPS